MAEDEKVYHSMDELLADLMPEFYAWKQEQMEKYLKRGDAPKCPSCLRADSWGWCSNREAIECRRCGRIAEFYKLGGADD